MLHHEIQGVSELRLSADQFRKGLGKVPHSRERRRGVRGRRADLARELISAPGHRPDEMAIGAEHLTQGGDLRREVVLLDDPVGPHAAHELVLAEDCAASVDEGHERLERPRAQLDRPAIGQQLAAMADDLESAKFNGCRMFGQPSHSGQIVHSHASGLFRTNQAAAKTREAPSRTLAPTIDRSHSKEPQ